MDRRRIRIPIFVIRKPPAEPTTAETPTEEKPRLIEVDLTDLVDAPSHTDEIIERLTEAFPGAELHLNEPPEER